MGGAGHQFQGKAGRVFKKTHGKHLGRVTGLDPAGPKFADGSMFNLKKIFEALPDLEAVLSSLDIITVMA